MEELKEDITNTPLYTSRMARNELLDLSNLIYTSTEEAKVLNAQMRENLALMDTFFSSQESIDTKIKEIETISKGLSEATSKTSDKQIVINSVEFQTILDVITPIVQKTVQKAIDESTKKILSSVDEKINSFVSNFDLSMNKLNDLLDNNKNNLKILEEENYELGKEFTLKIKELSNARDDIFYLTKYIKEFDNTVKKEFNVYVRQTQNKRAQAKKQSNPRKELQENQKSVVKKIIKKDIEEKDKGFFKGVFFKKKERSDD